MGPLEDPSLAPNHFGGDRDWYKLAVPGSLHGDAVPCLSIGKAGTRIDCFCLDADRLFFVLLTTQFLLLKIETNYKILQYAIHK